MMENFIYGWKVDMNVVVSSQNTTTVNSTGFDMSGYDQIVGMLVLSSAVGVPGAAAGSTAISFEAAEGTVQSTGSSDTYIALANTNVVCADAADNTLICEVVPQTDRYIRFQINGTTAVYSALHVLRHAQSMPVSQDATCVAELHVHSLSGTA